MLEKLKREVAEIEAFDLEVEAKVNELVNAVDSFKIEADVKEDDSKTVKAHKNRKLRVITREVEKFKRNINQYVLSLVETEELELEENGGNE